jgi:hypothetical protein
VLSWFDGIGYQNRELGATIANVGSVPSIGNGEALTGQFELFAVGGKCGEVKTSLAKGRLSISAGKNINQHNLAPFGVASLDGRGKSPFVFLAQGCGVLSLGETPIG